MPLSVLVGLFLQTVFLIVFWATERLDAAPRGELVRILLTYATVGALFFGAHLAFAESRRLRRVAIGTLVFVFTTLNAGRVMSDGPFDYGFVLENAKELMTPLGRHIVGSKLTPDVAAILVLAPIGAVVLLRFVPSLPWPGPKRLRYGLLAVCVAILVVPPNLHVTTHEAVSSFAASAFRFHAQSKDDGALVANGRYPLVRDQTPTPAAVALAGGATPRPPVILLFLESWNGWFTLRPRPNGQSYTPVFDRHAANGETAFVPFYGNSVQSSRGHFATLCSLSNSLRGKELVDFHERKLHCLPQVLREAGYQTLFLSATAQPTFERGQDWMRRIGFDAADFQNGDPAVHNGAWWGTGLQDDVFYKQLFARIDDAIAKDPQKPLFVTAANASNHYPFDEFPGAAPDPLEPTKRRGAYAASLMKADGYLETFFAELEKRESLKDAIVVLVGDHSFPAGEHGITINMLGGYDETFRTSLFVRWGKRHLPMRHEPRAYSQVDVAPTITDLLLLGGKTHFVGQSLFDEGPAKAVPLVQPYDGIYIGAVLWPWKLLRHEASDQEHLFDVRDDPQERIDRIHDPAAQHVLPELRDAIRKIRATHALLRDDRVWPQ